MLSEIFALDKRLMMANARLKQTASRYQFVHEFIGPYLQAYAEFNSLAVSDVIDAYNHFTKMYSKHLEIFQETNRYPVEYDSNVSIDKTTYDIALILSCVTDISRFNIVESLLALIENISSDGICVVGAGAGIELEIIRKLGKSKQVIAYDFHFNDFLKNRFSNFDLREEDFINATGLDAVNTLFAIEIIEHIEDYEKFLKKFHAITSPQAKLVCTTAANMPQFDHVHNFNDANFFMATLNKIGFNIVEHLCFSQLHVFSGIKSWNDWFVLKKRI